MKMLVILPSNLILKQGYNIFGNLILDRSQAREWNFVGQFKSFVYTLKFGKVESEKLKVLSRSRNVHRKIVLEPSTSLVGALAISQLLNRENLPSEPPQLIDDNVSVGHLSRNPSNPFLLNDSIRTGQVHQKMYLCKLALFKKQWSLFNITQPPRPEWWLPRSSI